MTGTRLTREGQAALALVIGVGVIALQTGNNLVYLVVSVLLAVLVLSVPLAAWNLRGLKVGRSLPEELFTDREGRGALVLYNPRRWLPAIAVRVAELDGPSTVVRVPAVDPGDEVYTPTGWSFDRRGEHRLGEIRLSSTFPFGLVERWCIVDRPAHLVVYPKPRSGLWTTESGFLGSDAGVGRAVGAFGDFSTLREYVPGDSIRAIHWRTTARLGKPVVVVRTGEGARQVVVKVSDRRGAGWETEIGRATGQVMRAFNLGCAVGLQLPDKRFEPREGAPWRRDLLEVLATLEERP